jgi:uncharacterized DUF497 family protein
MLKSRRHRRLKAHLLATSRVRRGSGKLRGEGPEFEVGSGNVFADLRFADAAQSWDWDSMLAQVDDRDDYGEERWIGIAPKGNRLHTVIFTMRGEETARIISLRKSSNSEIDKYEAESRK